MLSDYRVHPSLATRDISMARAWYSKTLGLEPIVDLERLLAYQVERTIFTIAETPMAGTAQNTVALWLVADLRAEMARLRARGLAFEDIDLGSEGRTVNGVMTNHDPTGGLEVLNAWFRDGDGNWIGMVEQPDHGDETPAELGIGLALAASDLARARRWYAEKLGLEPLHVYDDELVYRQGATELSIYTTPSAGSAKNTVGVWRVADLRSEVAALHARGVVFKDDEIGEDKTVDGVYTDLDDGTLETWFTDSEGNTLGIVEDHGVAIVPRS
jgi:catechol 2,3-dioxygenase-like lactoylglutathione lyase family enzyme